MNIEELSSKKLLSILSNKNKNNELKWLSLQDLKEYNVPESIFEMLKENIAEENKEQDKFLLVLNEDTLKKIEKALEKDNLINTTMENIFNKFNLTSKETDFQKYPKELEINRSSETIKTKDYLINNSTQKSTGFIKACFISPLIWLNEEYKLNLSDDLEDTEILGKIKKTKHFEISSREEQIYNAICYLIHRKIFNNQRTIFITYNELHKQLENNSKLRPEHKKEYESVVRRFHYLEILIDFTGAKYRDYKDFYKAEGNIKEPLIIVTSFAKAKVKYGKTTKVLDGFETISTKLMNLHFNHPNQTNYFVTKEIKEIGTKKKIEAKSRHIPKLESYMSKLHFLSQNKKNPYTDIKNETIFEELKEFNLTKEFEKAKKARHGARFLNRNIYNPIESMEEVKSVIKLDNGNNRIIWNIS